jgi:hypothetical protein
MHLQNTKPNHYCYTNSVNDIFYKKNVQSSTDVAHNTAQKISVQTAGRLSTVTSTVYLADWSTELFGWLLRGQSLIFPVSLNILIFIPMVA